MLDIKKCKRFIGIMMAFVLLSFFACVKERVPLDVAHIVTEAEQFADERILASVSETSVPEAKLTAVKNTMDDVVLRKQNSTSVTLVRCLVVAFMLLCVFQVAYRATIRRFGSHMIALWENICYIHQIDGEKGNVLLYT